MSGHRLAAGGRIDRTRPLSFSFDGVPMEGYAGDTLASALLANGVSTVARSFKYHRRRGIYAAGLEEPNAIVTVGEGARATPNLKATQVPLYAGLVARSVNRWPSLNFDVGAIAGAVARFLPAGFYYKTFMKPDWHLFEPAIRRAAGLGEAPSQEDADRYEKLSAHCDVLVVGGGPAGLAATRAAAAGGGRVILAEHDGELGGRLLADAFTIDGLPGADWARHTVQALAGAADLRILRRTTVFGYYDHNLVGAYEQLTPPGATPAEGMPAGRLWRIRAKRVVLATGAFERPLVFGGNDLPGVMLASAVRSYLARWAVAPGSRAVIATNNDDAYRTALALADAGVAVACLCDARDSVDGALARAVRARGIEVATGTVPRRARGAGTVETVELQRRGGGTRRVEADLLAISGGWNPAVHLLAQSGGRLRFDEAHAAFLPETHDQRARSAGACNGAFALTGVVAQGHDAGLWAASATAARLEPPQAASEDAAPLQPLWEVAGGGKAWVDLLSDVTADDVRLAAREHYVSVEHLKRYTTLGMATDQGKTSNVNGLAILAAATGRAIPEVGTTRFRPPFDPIPIGALAGRERGDFYRPRARLPMHDWHVAHGALLEDFGEWQRPAAYPGRGEDLHAAAAREAAHVRNAVGIFDGSPLGKILVEGPDAATFLDRMYVGTMSTLAVGRVRYGLMLTEHGVVTDDGVCARLGPQSFLVGTTSAAAGRIAAGFDEWLQGEWPGLRVFTTNLTHQYGVITLTGPKARAVLHDVGTDIPLARDAFAHMHWRDGHVGGVPARVMRVSFTGELSYEIAVPARRAAAIWERIVDAGASHGLQPFGVEALMTLRIEKGYLHVGSDTDGTTLPDDVGMAGGVARKVSDFVGRRSLARPEALRADRHQLVGILPDDGTLPLLAGAHVVDAGGGSDGYVTSACWSPALERWIGLGMVKRGRARRGEAVVLVDEGRRRGARLVEPCFLDAAGARLDG